MDESILEQIRALVLGSEDDNSFDTDLIIHINSALSFLYRLGVNYDQEHPFRIHGITETWKDFLGENEIDLEVAKDYVNLKVKLIFDPPVSTVAMQAMAENLSEMEFTINDICDRKMIDKKKEEGYTTPND